MIHGGDKLLHKVAAHAGRQVLLALYLALQHIFVEVWRREDDTVEMIFHLLWTTLASSSFSSCCFSCATCQRGVEVFKLHDLVGALAACQAVIINLKVLRDGLLHVAGGVAEVSGVVKCHTLQEKGLHGGERSSSLRDGLIFFFLIFRSRTWLGNAPRTASPRGPRGTPPRQTASCSTSCSWSATGPWGSSSGRCELLPRPSPGC